jgi:Zn-dependent protease with chaperone function
MAASDPASIRPMRLNPFAFPSNTDLHFVLLMVSVFSTGGLLFSLVYDAIPSFATYKHQSYESCVYAAAQGHPSSSAYDLVNRVRSILDCTAGVDRIQAGWTLGGALLMLALAAGIYWVHPHWKIRRERLTPVPAEITAYLVDLCREIGLTPPTFLWNPLDGSLDAVAFGRWRHHYVALSGGRAMQFYTDRATLRAVMLHELAHLRNDDVDKSYLTEAAWHTFVVTLIACSVVLVATTLSLATVAQVSWRVVPLVLLVSFTRAALLRAREVYADVRASTWGLEPGALERALSGISRPPHPWWSGGPLLSTHPDRRERIRALADTRRLFRFGFWEAFATGMAAGATLPAVEAVLALLRPVSLAGLQPLGAALPVAVLTVGVVGLGIWRLAFAGLASAERPRGIGSIGCGLGLGLVLGQRLSLGASPFRGQMPDVGIAATILADKQLLALEVMLSGILVASMVVFCRWMAAGASTWLEVAAAHSSPRPAYRLGLTISGVLLTLWLGIFYLAYLSLMHVNSGGAFIEAIVRDGPDRLFGSMEAGSGAASATALIAVSMLSLPMLMLFCVWGFPLAAWMKGRAAAAADSPWAFLDGPVRSLSLPRQPPLRPDVAFAIGAVGGAVFCSLSHLAIQVVFLALIVRELVAPLIQVTSGWVGGSSFWGVLATLAWFWITVGESLSAAVIQTVVVAIVAFRVRRLGALHGLFAAFVTDVAMLLGTAGLDLWIIGALDAPAWIFVLVVCLVLITGSLLAMPVAFGVSAVSARRDRTGPPGPDPERAVRPARLDQIEWGGLGR